MNRNDAQALTAAQRRALLCEAALGLVYPRCCPFCGAVLGTRERCEACEEQLRPYHLTRARLAPESHYFGALSGAAAVYRYEGPVRRAVLRLKYGGAAWSARELGNCMAQALFACTFYRKYGILLPERADAADAAADVIVPVPPSDDRRGYHVTELLARPLALALDAPLQPHALERRRFERHQAGLPLAERLANVAGAFAVAPGCAVEGRRVLLVDDVITTGATAAACTAALLDAGAESVFAVGLASSQWQQDAPDEEQDPSWQEF